MLITKNTPPEQPIRCPSKPKRWRKYFKGKFVRGWVVEVEDWTIVNPKDCVPETIEGVIRDNYNNYIELPIGRE